MEENKPINNEEQDKPLNNEQQLNPTSTDEPIPEVEQPITQNLSTEALAKVDPQPVTDQDMEVHHHSHESHGKKNWKSYFWEFLMLFLAVFCGFLAEYQLEHVIEHNRERQYMKSMLTDLMADTAHLKVGFPRKEDRIKAIDSLFDYFAIHKDKKTIPAYVHNLMRRSSWDIAYDRNNITIIQLKNSGNMRLIRKKNVSDSILSYDFLWGRAGNYFNETYWSNSGIINDYIKKIISDYSLLPYYKRNNTTAARLEGDARSVSVQIDTKLLLEYLNHLHKIKTTIVQDKEFYQDIEKSAERLIELIKKEYHLK